MIYLVTGPDNSGKDTVIEVLQTLLPAPAHVLHYSTVTGKNKADILAKSRVMYAQAVDMARYASSFLCADVIFNRFWEGEMIYGPMYRDYTAEEAQYVLDLETLSPHDVKGIFVTANPATLVEREDGKSQSDADIVKITREIRLFTEFTQKSRYDFTTINTTFTDKESLIRKLKEIINANV